MSISDKITRLQNAKEDIADAITSKGGTVNEGDGFEEFASDIDSISTPDMSDYYTKEETDEAISDANPVYQVNLTYESSTRNKVGDKTFQQVWDAFRAGKLIYIIYKDPSSNDEYIEGFVVRMVGPQQGGGYTVANILTRSDDGYSSTIWNAYGNASENFVVPHP